MQRCISLVILVLGATVLIATVASPSARADCRTSASAVFSMDVRLSAASGIGCFSDVRVFDGALCAPERLRWATALGCSETRRMIVSDRGRLVTLLAPRASRRGWEIVRVFEPGEGHLSVRSVRLEELPGLPPTARESRLSLDASALRVELDPAVAVDVAELETLGRPTGRRRLGRP